MTDTKLHNGRRGRRFREAVDGPVIMRNYATMPTAELAERLGLSVKQIKNYVFRQNSGRWARKEQSYLSSIIFVYPNLEASLKDKKDAQGNIVEVAKIEDFTLAGAKSRLGAMVSPKFSSQFASGVSWQRVDASGAAIEEEDITDNGGENTGENTGGNTGGDNGGGGGVTPPGGNTGNDD